MAKKVDILKLPSDQESLKALILNLEQENVNLQKKNISLYKNNESLKKDKASLEKDNIELKESINKLEGDILILDEKISKLTFQISKLRTKLYGQSSEKLSKKEKQELTSSINELELELCHLEAKKEKLSSEISSKKSHPEQKKKNKPKRQKLPDTLVVEKKVIEPEFNCPSCGNQDFRQISEDVTECLKYRPGKIIKTQYSRPRCACKACDKIIQAELPSRPIEKGIAESSFIAHIIVEKYVYHMPVHRQIKKLFRENNIKLSDSTVAGWIIQCGQWLKVIADKIRSCIFAYSHIHSDDTTIRLLVSGHKKTHTARIWAYVKDPINYDPNEPRAICYYYSHDRRKEHIAKHMQGFQGTLHADAYSGYDHLYINKDGTPSEIIESACWAHMRRKFTDIEKNSTKKKVKIAEYIIDKIAEIYRYEKELKNIPPDIRLKQRKKYIEPRVLSFFKDLRKFQEHLSVKGPTYQAIGYALNHEKAFKTFLTDGKVEIDNNAAERAMRTVAMGRKNSLFIGSEESGQVTADILTIIASAEANNIEPKSYIAKLLDVVPDYHFNKIEQLLPWNIAKYFDLTL